MNKAELIARIAKGAGLNKEQARKALNAFITETIEAVRSGDEVCLQEFGRFLAANPRPMQRFMGSPEAYLKWAEARRRRKFKFLPAKKLTYFDTNIVSPAAISVDKKD